MARTTTKRTSPKATRNSHKATKAKSYIEQLQENYVDTGGEELDETVTTDVAKQAKIDKANLARIEKAKARLFQGTIQATRLYKKDLPFTNCSAVSFMAINDDRQTVTYVNAYGPKGSDEVMPRSSYDPATYTYPIKSKVVEKKIATEYAEVEDREEWPSFVIPAVAAPAKRKTRK